MYDTHVNPRTGRPPRSDYVPLAEAARLLGVSTRTVERMMDRGELGYRTTPGGSRRLYRTGLDEYLASKVDTGSGEA